MPDIKIEVEWLHPNTVREMHLTITAIRNEIYAGRTMRAMDMLRALRDRIGIYENGGDHASNPVPVQRR